MSQITSKNTGMYKLRKSTLDYSVLQNLKINPKPLQSFGEKLKYWGNTHPI